MANIKLNKVSEGNWNVVLNGDVVGTVELIGGMYKAELTNGATVRAVNQTSLKSLLTKSLKGGR